MSDVCADLKKLIDAHKFMDDDPINKDKHKQSTYQRWNAQVSECILSECTLSECTLSECTLNGSGTYANSSGWSHATVYYFQETWRQCVHHL